MKNKLLLPVSLLAVFALASCEEILPVSSGNQDEPSSISYPDGESVSIDVTETPEIPSIIVEEGDFVLSTEDGSFTQEENIYTITAAGTYSAEGILEDGQIVINAKDAEVVLELNGATISSTFDSPIKALKAEKLEISAKKNTENGIYDNRDTKVVDDENLGEGAINAKCDLKLKGAGVLVVEGNYNNGVHTTKDLTIQKEELYVLAYNNAIKGKNSITMNSGNVTAVSKNGNGLKTDNTDVSSKGNQRGIISINGGTLYVDSTYDAIDASYNMVVDENNDESVDTVITIKTGKNATYSSNYSSVDTSSKGLKADNDITINAGTITIAATDDAIHANYGDEFDNGGTGAGTVNIFGGVIGIASGDDGIHADHTLNVNNGSITITNAYEGLEANHINFNGGEAHIYATDDGVNAANKVNETPTISVAGGFLDITIAKGDTDGIDSNGTYSQTGGVVVSRGSPNNASNMSTGLDCDNGATIYGGTFIAFNGVEKNPTTGNGVLYAYYGTTGQGGPGGPGGRANGVTFASGQYTLSGGDMSFSFYNQYVYSKFLVYSDQLKTGTSYTLVNGSNTLLSWTQSSSSQSIS